MDSFEESLREESVEDSVEEESLREESLEVEPLLEESVESLSEVREGAFSSETFWRWLSVFASGEIVEPLSVVNGVVSGADVDLMLVGKGLCTMKMYTMTIKASAPRPKRAGGRFVPLVKFCRTPEFILLAMVKILYKVKGWKSAKVGDATCLVST